MKKNRAKKIATWIVVPLMAAIFLLDIATIVIGNGYSKDYYPVPYEEYAVRCDDKIHFLNVANSDAILIESNGHFALIDAGEGNNNPRRKSEAKGYEDVVIDYVKKITSDENGTAHLDFIVGTHMHYDHIGSFHSLINDPSISVSRAYFKEYDPAIDKKYEVESWKLGELYNEIIDDLKKKNVETISDIPQEKFVFGDFEIQFFNAVNQECAKGKGENGASIGTLITKGGKRAFLAADITKSTGIEQVVAPQIGKIDLLKAGHHGYFGSSSADFLRAVSPEMIIVTNQAGKVYPNVKWNFTMVAKAPFFGTYDHNGIIACFTDSGEIILQDNIH